MLTESGGAVQSERAAALPTRGAAPEVATKPAEQQGSGEAPSASQPPAESDSDSESSGRDEQGDVDSQLARGGTSVLVVVSDH